MTYQELKSKHSEEMNALPIAFAFNDQQFTEALQKLGASSPDEIYSIGSGGLILRKDSKTLSDTLNRHMKEMETAMQDDQFLIQALIYELDNHEYGYTGDPSDAFEALDLDPNQERIKAAFKEAIKHTYKKTYA